MAIVKRNVVTSGLSGRLGKDLVFKVYGDKTVVAVYPRRSSVVASVRQLSCRERFARAVAQVRFWLADVEKRRFLEGLRRQWGSVSAYHAGIRYFMRGCDAEGGTVVTDFPPRFSVEYSGFVEGLGAFPVYAPAGTAAFVGDG